ncbi:hypothetical protein F5Y08DRAFT_305039 [Xylaria arbuscula]|nr:hypothetical protein F5Y08DRAFT_305039 [Xylaria arbuscula]
MPVSVFSVVKLASCPATGTRAAVVGLILLLLLAHYSSTAQSSPIPVYPGPNKGMGSGNRVAFKSWVVRRNTARF